MEIKGRSNSNGSHSKPISGSPKKGGAGGKGTWGKGGIDDLKQSPLDSRDPNYQSDEETQEVVLARVELETPLQQTLKQYFVEGDVDEAITRVKEVKFSRPEFIRKAITLAMERQPYERELVSRLLSAMYGSTATSEEFAQGFQDILNVLDDVVLDVPNAREMVAKFIARAVVDEVIPPATLKHFTAENTLAADAIALANALVNDPHRSKKLEHIWGPGAMDSVKRLKREASMLVSEYLTTGDMEEADKCVRKLSAPSFHFQLVRQALRMALSGREEQQKKVMDLLAFFSKTGLIVPDHVTQGFKACSDELIDIKLDVPTAPAAFAEFVKTAQQGGWLSSDFKVAAN
eukprot:TRINITY_DN1012_c0_g1_i1.p1 TRINITY_DN1012_c0_g1~~TRINITY_DN1012_c0_g1_i1.p1  ORF type:complete len:347 (+),score=124.40 TRINITY_DN1012_c0_g1_i1:222-1262(+)